MKYHCPICHGIIKSISLSKTDETSFFPFCSERCKLIDLGAWLDTEYKFISGSTDNLPDMTENGQ